LKVRILQLLFIFVVAVRPCLNVFDRVASQQHKVQKKLMFFVVASATSVAPTARLLRFSAPVLKKEESLSLHMY